MKTLILSFAAMLLCFVCSAGVLYISHRGESADAPENTMAAFRLAWERGTDGIECDVHRTADGEVVVIHDGDTGRVAGTKLPVARSSAEELRKLDVGSFRGRQFAGERLPLFSELLTAMPGKGLVYIELKDREPGLAEAVAALVRRHGKGPEQVRFISFHADAVRAMKELLPEYRAYFLAGLSWDAEKKRLKQDLDEMVKTAKEAKADGVDLSFGIFWDEALVKKFRDAGLEVHCWTVDDPVLAEHARKLGVDSITSSRLRYYGYRAAFEAAGFAPEFHPFFSDAYLTRLYAGRGKSRLLAAAALVRRFAASTRLPEKLLIEYELLPELPYGIEARFLRGRRYVLNFDDDVWIKYEGRGRLADKYDRLVAGACGVVCANDLLLEKVLKFNPDAVKIPTAVDLDAFPLQAEKFPRFTIAWIGTPVTYSYLERHAEALRAMSRAAEFELLVIAKKSLGPRAVPGVRMRFEEWSPENEAALERLLDSLALS